MRYMIDVKRKLIACSVAALLAACLVPAAADASYTRVVEPLYSQPSPYTPTGTATLPYVSIAMTCWTDTRYWVAGSNRWFLVWGTGWAGSNMGWVTGWLPANEVYAQTRVRHC